MGSDTWSGTGEPRGPETKYEPSDVWSHTRDVVLEQAEAEEEAAEEAAEVEAVAEVRKGRRPAPAAE